MFKIGEFSKLGQVSVRMLRHYDSLGLLKPSYTDKFTSYRYYSIDQLARLNRLIALKELGFSLEQVAPLLNSNDLSLEQLRGMLMLRQAEIERELQAGQMQLAKVQARLLQIELEGQPSPYEIVVKAVPAQVVASIRQVVPAVTDMGYYCQSLYEQLYTALQSRHITPLQPEITVYHNDEYTETDLDVEVMLPVQPKYLRSGSETESISFAELSASQLTAALIYEGPFREITPAILALLQWVGRHNHTIAGPLRELHLSGPAHEVNAGPELPIIELQLPIQPIADRN
jgi:DNA-binding transcriptional MerR regulator